MITPPIPKDDRERLESLSNLHILDTPPEERFDRITRLAKRMFEVPIVAISLVDESRQWFKSTQGLEACETSRDVSFCGHAILSDEIMIVEDALEDERFTDNPLVTSEPRIRFYAGQPLSGPDGRNVGTLCIIDHAPRKLTDADLLALHDLASMAESELQIARMSHAQQELLSQLKLAERRALRDPLTGLWNRAGIMMILERELAQAVRTDTGVCLLLADIDHFKSINDQHGHPSGDAVLKEVGRRLRSSLRSSDVIGRFGGEEFIFVLPGTDLKGAGRLAERIRVTLSGEPIPLPQDAGLNELSVTLSIGLSMRKPGEETSVDALVSAADQALYRAKENGRNRVVQASVG